ncbi:MAG: AAA family ATPase [Polyangiaceae bacterium]|nr:AAA family ATPase [Polyangiaceae bacterium]
MHLARVRLVGLGPFDDLSLSFAEEDGPPRRLSVIFGGGGVGKTTLLTAIASTRPGYAVVQHRNRTSRQGHAVALWHLGQDDPGRPHPLRILSPNVQLDEPEEVALLHRREQAAMEKRAAEGGFVLLYFPSVRWFSRTPVLLTAPERTIMRYDVRSTHSTDDATRGDLARETKQALSFASIASALCLRDPAHPQRARLLELDQTMRQVISGLTGLTGYPFLGADPMTFEPLFGSPSGEAVLFDELPTGTRNLAAFGALTIRAVYSAYPDTPPHQAEAVVLIDDVELHQETTVTRRIASTLRQVLPRVQWILTTSSATLAASCETGELLALRRTPPSQRVEIYEGSEAVVH